QLSVHIRLGYVGILQHFLHRGKGCLKRLPAWIIIVLYRRRLVIFCLQLCLVGLFNQSFHSRIQRRQLCFNLLLCQIFFLQQCQGRFNLLCQLLIAGRCVEIFIQSLRFLISLERISGFRFNFTPSRAVFTSSVCSSTAV